MRTHAYISADSKIRTEFLGLALPLRPLHLTTGRGKLVAAGMVDYSAAAIALKEMGGAVMGNKARTKRAIRVLDGMLQQPAASIPTQHPDPHQAKATYRLLGNSKVAAPALLSGHIQATVERCSQVAVVLAIQDTSEADLTSHVATRGLGPIGDGNGRGFIFHTAIVVDAEEHHQVLGVLHQRTWVREDGPSKNSRDLPSAERKKEKDRESLKWMDTSRAVHEVLAKTSTRIIHVADREGDIFELFETYEQLQDSYVLRLVQNRCLVSESVGEAKKKGLRATFPKLFDAVHQAPVLATKTVPVRKSKEHTAHLATVEIRAARVQIQPPQNRVPRGEAIEVNIVQVWEPDPPEGSEPLCWYLLTKEPVQTAEQVLFVVACYEARWIIEEFHMGLKTGCSLEKRQFEEVEGFYNFLAFASVTAWHLLRLRDTARQAAPPPASEVLTSSQLEVLRGLRPKMPSSATAYDALRAIATLGGFLGRKGDGEPGWRTLWKGFQLLLMAERGYLLASRHPASPPGLEEFG